MAKIIVLEDDTATRRLVSAVVKKLGHEALEFDNGAEGLLNVMAEQPDLVISDVQMPKMNGFEVLTEIRFTPETADTPVILLTSLAGEADIQRGIEQGADDYITKPFEPVALARAINAQLQNLAKRRLHGGGRLPPIITKAAPPAEPAKPAKPQREASPSGYHSSFYPDREEEPLSGFANTSAGEMLDSLPNLDPFPSLDDPVFAPKAPPPPPPPAPNWPTQHFSKAWAVHMNVLGDDQLQAALPVKVWRSLLRQLFLPVSKDPALRGADYLSLADSRLTLYFVDRGDGQGATTAAHAVQAMLRSSIECRRWALDLFSGFGVPQLRIGISLDFGGIDVVRKPLEFGGERDHVEGAMAHLIGRLREGEPPVMWRVLGTEAALQQSPGLYRFGAHMDVSVGRKDVKVYALQGVAELISEGSGVDPRAWI
jgi:CheY-like chemotaxis protein